MMTTGFLRARGADKALHSGGSLLDHLAGVEAILRRWGAPETVCRAGLFHSVYGTEAFGEALAAAAERGEVQTAIGRDAERLVALYCAMRRSSVQPAIERGEPYVLIARDGGPLDVTTDELRGLVAIVWANTLEQDSRAPVTDRAAAAASLERSAHLLPPAAVAELRRAFASVDAPSLARLLSKEDAPTFLSKHWPSARFVSHGPVDRLANLVTYEFDDLVRARKGYTRAFFRDLEGEKRDLIVQPGQERELYDAGFTIYFHGLHTPGMDAWVSALDAELGLIPGATRVSAFASKRGAGLKAHYDLNSNFICQARGVKRWRLAENTHVRNPTIGFFVGEQVSQALAMEAPNGFPSELPTPFETVEMRPGSVMFMPRGIWHDTETVDESSLHFNIQTGLVTWKELMHFLMTTPLLHAESYRGDVKTPIEGEAVARDAVHAMADKLRELAATLESDSYKLSAAALQRFVAGRRLNV